ncbi:BTB/POZ domain-containing protein 16 [Chelonia mydas]|uniref:BTB/POZ domain-containing protein 16 n=1 Tax=Chelonia mydas TaxID=8469 RepID=M7BU56_CHEMY|nr:BTB/POZ domain-containing protein 16 [Chelonia mydas]
MANLKTTAGLVSSRKSLELAQLTTFVPKIPSLDTKPADWVHSNQACTKEVIFSHTQKMTEDMEPDVALECLGFLWELHRIYLFKSKTLSQLLISAVEPVNINDLESQHKSKKEGKHNKQSNPAAQKTKALGKEKSKMKKIIISLDVQDPEVTRIGKHLEDLRQINFLPLPWLTQILSHHYHALENGGDMTLQRDFSMQAVRFGLLLKQEPRYHEEIISMYGFFFEIKAIRHEASAYSFYIQRVKHTDQALSFFTAERSPVSLRQEREVKYEIKAQCLMEGKWREFSTDQLTQKFGITKPSCKSQVLKARIPSIPIYVTYALLFPSS